MDLLAPGLGPGLRVYGPGTRVRTQYATQCATRHPKRSLIAAGVILSRAAAKDLKRAKRVSLRFGFPPLRRSAPLPQKLQTFLELGNGHQELVLAQDAFFL